MLPEDFQSLRLKIASPDEIRSWSHGEVIKPETINYRTQRPEKDGLFSERIFGPTKDWECYCGKYRRIRYKGIVCDKCGVEVTRAIVRRERMGHIELACPVAHIWFLKSIPSRIGLFLGVPQQNLERVIYYTAYIITSVNEDEKKTALEDLEKEYKSKKGDKKSGKGIVDTLYKQRRDEISNIKPLRIISEMEFLEMSKKYGHIFEAGIGSEAIKKLLETIDLKKGRKDLEKQLAGVKGVLEKKKALLRLKMFKSFIKNDLRPEWMFLSVLPVLPPDLRPMVALDGGRYATSDSNDLYRRVINRNNRLKKLLELSAPEVIVRNEKRMLQEAVDALLDNSARESQAQMTAQKRPLKSLADILKGKQGRFRQNLLGKRVDYSGRSVIVVGPELHHYECGLPKKMALELFRPFVVNKLMERGIVHNIRSANRLIDQGPAEVWGILEEVIKDRRVLLNRAPTLHRLGIQAFQPVLIEDFAIRIPPLVCTAFNADFDGDQMAVHLPLTNEAQKEARELMYSARNFLKPASGDPIIDPTKDILLGCYYLTKLKDGEPHEGKVFSSFEEASYAYENKFITLQTKIRVPNTKSSILKNDPDSLKIIDDKEHSLLDTSFGRMLFNNIFPENFPYVNEMVNKKFLQRLTEFLVGFMGDPETAIDIIDKLKSLGFRYATRSGITWSISDLVVPAEKENILAKATAEVKTIEGQYQEGLLTNEERKSHVVQIWQAATVAISKNVNKTFDQQGNVFSIVDSGARGSWSQVNQMTGMKGLVQNPNGETIELPIKSSYKDGFSVLEYFIASHGARKGSSDTALKTANAGYLTRRLVDSSQDILATEEDCGTKEGLVVIRKEGDEYGHNFSSRLFARTSSEEIKINGKVIVGVNEVIDRKASKLIEASDIQSVKIRSPITCKSVWGVCAKCYGYDLAYNNPVKIGTPVGIIAAQSIGEPGTQLTLRTFHTGGVAGKDITHGLPRIEELLEVRSPKYKAIIAENDGKIISVEEGDKDINIVFEPVNAVGKEEKSGKSKKKLKKENATSYTLPKGSRVLVKSGDKVIAGQKLSEGSIDLKDLLRATNREQVEKYIMSEVQKIYVSEGVNINNKHLEIILKQMFSRVKIKDPGDSEFLIGEVISKSKFIEENRRLKTKGKAPAKAMLMLLGVTKSALASDSFLSAASFQETTRVMVTAATEGRVDNLRGLKENVIIGRLIPAGTGYKPKEEKK
jgi:DNA-directed RNA polymerase subunit beta'